MKYLIDTNICVHILRGKYELNKKIKSKGYNNCVISEITYAELIYGAECSDNIQKNHEKINYFFTGFKIFSIK